MDADQLIDCIRKTTNAVVISHEAEATERLFSAVRYYIDNMEVQPLVSIDNKREIKFPKRGSSYFVGTAGQRAFGRGDTIDRAHLSEAAFYPDLEKILAGIAEAAEYGQIDIETTPNGREKFYDLWQKAKTGRSPYTNIFIPWFLNPEYDSTKMTEKERQGLSEGVQKLFAVPDDEFMAGIDPEEKRLVARIVKEYGFLLTAGQLKWRRYKIWDKGIYFYQEYPEDDVSCFLQSGRSVFSKITTDKTKREDLENYSNWPEEKKTEWASKFFYAGVDCAEGTKDGDRHCLAIIDAPGDQSQARVIYEYASNEPIDVFWFKILPILRSIRCSLGVEKNGVGVAHIEHLKHLPKKISFQEWETTGANRPTMISQLEEAYRKEELIESYDEAENEARDMIYTAANRAEHQKDKHDDRVFARAIAWQMRMRPRPRVTLL